MAIFKDKMQTILVLLSSLAGFVVCDDNTPTLVVGECKLDPAATKQYSAKKI